MSELTRQELDRLLLTDDPAQALRDALADGSLDQLIPEIRREMDVPQRTHYHQYTVLEHSLRTMALMPPKIDERLAGLFHDIGKRRTTTIKERTGEEQYIGHAGAGARMVRPILERLGYDRALVDRVVRWIERHMDLHMAARDGHSLKARRKLLGRIGEDLEVLQRLQLADIATMAPETAEEKGREARKYQRMLEQTEAPSQASR
ncbi:MAG TPA: HD domain-containing protein [Candidatus Limnocylindria bacterium]|nr:HD domain-containing protein [Candidatus Limnocylindria bacterium]